ASTGRRLLGKKLLTQNAPWEPPQRGREANPLGLNRFPNLSHSILRLIEFT
ncbi:MAG: hypothetical protein RLZZ74_211, partial [Cyanobacteriota bacterium]